MGRATLVLINDDIRRKAVRWAQRAPAGTRIQFNAPKRTIPQNARFFAMLTDVATQLKWHGTTLSVDDWKLIFMEALHREMRIVPNLDNTGFVQLGRSSSELSVAEMGELMELISAFGANHGVVFHG